MPLVMKKRNTNVQIHLLVLSDKGSDAMHFISSMGKQVYRALPDNVKIIVFYISKKLSICFNVRNKTVF